MLTGLISKVEVNQKIYSIQTEDKGKEAAEIETLIYCGGQVMAAWRTSYAQLLDKEDCEEMIYRLMKLQHREIANQLKKGILSFDQTDVQLKAKKKVADMDEMIINYLMDKVEVEELKLKVDAALELKKGNQAIIRVSTVKNISSAPIAGANITFSVVNEADSQPQEVFSGTTNALGKLEASFIIPVFSGKGNLVIDAESPWGKDRIIENIK